MEQGSELVSPSQTPRGSRIPTPKRGILKRIEEAEDSTDKTENGIEAQSFSTRRLSLPVRGRRYVDAWIAQHPKHSSQSRIPKLTVSWWETNSVPGEAPVDQSSTASEDDGASKLS